MHLSQLQLRDPWVSPDMASRCVISSLMFALLLAAMSSSLSGPSDHFLAFGVILVSFCGAVFFEEIHCNLNGSYGNSVDYSL